MVKKPKEPQEPKPEGEPTPKKQPEEETPEGGEKTPEQKQIESLQIQKEHQREKREEAEGRARELEEEVARLKTQASAPSDTELAKQHPDWEYLDETEKAKIREQRELDKRIARLEEERAWERDFTKAVKEFPKLADKKAEFKEFCYQDEHIGTKNILTLAKAFLFEETPEPAPQEPKKGLEKPTGGRAIPSTELTPEDLERLRINQPKLYEKMLRQGRFDKVKFVPDKE